MCEKSCETCANDKKCNVFGAEDCTPELRFWVSKDTMTFEKAEEIINKTPGCYVDKKFEEIEVPITFCYETYPDEIQEAFAFLQCKGYMLT